MRTAILLCLLATGCTESAIAYDAAGKGAQLPDIEVETGWGKAYLLMDFDQASSPYETTATDAHSQDPRIAEVVRTQRDASAGDGAHGHVFVVYGHMAGETDIDVWKDDHRAGTVHVRVLPHAAD